MGTGWDASSLQGTDLGQRKAQNLTLLHPQAVALRFVRCDQLTTGLAPAGMRPCWAHNEFEQRLTSLHLIQAKLEK